MEKTRSFTNKFHAGIRDVGGRDGDYRQRIDMTSPIPWWRQIHDSDLLYDSAADVFSGAHENADPANHLLPIFDNGYFYEDHVDILPKYLENYEANNPHTLGDPTSIYANAKFGFQKHKNISEESDKLRKGFMRSYKRKITSQQNHIDRKYSKLEKRKFKEKFKKSSTEDEGISFLKKLKKKHHRDFEYKYSLKKDLYFM